MPVVQFPNMVHMIIADAVICGLEVAILTTMEITIGNNGFHLQSGCHTGLLELLICGDIETDIRFTHITSPEVKTKNRPPIRPVATYPIYKNMYNTGLGNN